MSINEEPNPTQSTEEEIYEEPDFDAEIDEEDEAKRIEAVHQSNRRRVLIPLVLLIILFAVLSLLGEPKTPTGDNQPATEDTKDQ